MSKFCTACGSQMADNATFCTNCGTPLANAPGQGPMFTPPPAPVPPPAQAPVNNGFPGYDQNTFPPEPNPAFLEDVGRAKAATNKNTIIAACIIGAAVIAIVVVLLLIFTGGGYKKPLDNLVKSYETGKGSYYAETLTPAQKSSLEEDYINKSNKYDSIEEYYDDVFGSKQESLKDRYGDDFSISYNITKKTELKDSMLKSYASGYKSTFGKKVDISAGYDLDLEVTWKGADKDEDGDKNITVLKVDGDWVLYNGSADMLMPKKLGGTNNGSGYSYDYDDDDDDYDLGDIDLGELEDLFS